MAADEIPEDGRDQQRGDDQGVHDPCRGVHVSARAFEGGPRDPSGPEPPEEWGAGDGGGRRSGGFAGFRRGRDRGHRRGGRGRGDTGAAGVTVGVAAGWELLAGRSAWAPAAAFETASLIAGAESERRRHRSGDGGQRRRRTFDHRSGRAADVADPERGGEDEQRSRCDQIATRRGSSRRSERADPASLEGMRAHEEGQTIGASPVLKQLSVLLGSFPRRGTKRVSLPIWPAFVTRISSTEPAASECAKRGNESRALPGVSDCLVAVATRLWEV